MSSEIKMKEIQNETRVVELELSRLIERTLMLEDELNHLGDEEFEED